MKFTVESAKCWAELHKDDVLRSAADSLQAMQVQYGFPQSVAFDIVAAGVWMGEVLTVMGANKQQVEEVLTFVGTLLAQPGDPWRRVVSFANKFGDELAGDLSSVEEAAASETKLLKDMNEPELSQHIGGMMRKIKSWQTPDTIGSILVAFGEDGINQYGATIDPECAPEALREIADKIERRETIRREWDGDVSTESNGV